MVNLAILKKLASPQQKVQRFKITNPSNISFVYNFENQIDWNKIKNEADLITTIQQKLNDLSSEDNIKNSLLTDINIQRQIDILEQRAITNPQDNEARHALDYFRSRPKEAKDELLKAAN
ncbi:MAG: hypothetical protein WC375_00390 [Methanomassiliicoccales archaeon]